MLDTMPNITEFDISCLEKLFQAIIAVDERYIKYGSFSDELKDFETDSPVERVFTYELYHQWRKLIEKEDIVLNGEIIKCTSEGKKFYPDFVLHGGQENCECQEIVCEVKRFCSLSQTNMIEDLQKLLLFTASGNDSATFNHPFKFGVFIVVGCDMNTLIKRLSDVNIAKYHNLICVTYNKEHELECIRLGNHKNVQKYEKGNSFDAIKHNFNDAIQ